jgi:hypothetical protein
MNELRILRIRTWSSLIVVLARLGYLPWRKRMDAELGDEWAATVKRRVAAKSLMFGLPMSSTS